MTNPLRLPRSSYQCYYPPLSRKTLDALETKLCFLRDEWAAISVIYDSLRNVYQTQLVLSRVPERHRELLLDYDDLSLKVQQLERKVENLELEFNSALRGISMARHHHQQQQEQQQQQQEQEQQQQVSQPARDCSKCK
ncbi:hypothetical protein BX666DRAFT_1898289 [Dichotomocladium elegans]|nr:hypothetical protein BX666DRAFT_1898289 [Dichotomocladium elegans]